MKYNKNLKCFEGLVWTQTEFAMLEVRAFKAILFIIFIAWKCFVFRTDQKVLKRLGKMIKREREREKRVNYYEEHKTKTFAMIRRHGASINF